LGFDCNVREYERIRMEGTVGRVERGEVFGGKVELVCGIGHEKCLLGSGIEHCQVGRTGHGPIDAVFSSSVSFGLVGGGPLVILDSVFPKPQGKVSTRTHMKGPAVLEGVSLTDFLEHVQHIATTPVDPKASAKVKNTIIVVVTSKSFSPV